MVIPMPRTSLVLATSFALALVTAPAWAQDSATERAADAAFEEGRAAMTRGDLGLACTKLAESDRLVPSGRAALNLADCLERRRMYASAYAKFLDAASRAARAHRPDAERHARDRATSLEPHLGKMAVIVPKESELAGLEIRRDGVIVPASQWGVAELADPGTTHTFEATAPGKTAWTLTVTIEEGKVARAEVRWADGKGGAKAAPIAAPVQEPIAQPATATSTTPVGWPAPEGTRDHESGPPRALAFGLLGLGAAAAVVGTVGGLQVLSAKDEVEENCTPAPRRCNAAGADAADRGATWSVVSPIAFAVSAVSLGAGVYFLVKGGDGRRGEAAPSSRVAFSVGPTGGVVSGRF